MFLSVMLGGALPFYKTGVAGILEPLRDGVVEATVHRFYVHRGLASRTRFVMFLDNVGLTLTYQLSCACLSFLGRAEALPIQQCLSRPANMIVGHRNASQFTRFNLSFEDVG